MVNREGRHMDLGICIMEIPVVVLLMLITAATATALMTYSNSITLLTDINSNMIFISNKCNHMHGVMTYMTAIILSISSIVISITLLPRFGHSPTQPTHTAMGMGMDMDR